MSLTYLINPSERKILDNAGDRMPIGLMSIASNNPDTKVYDLNHTPEKELMRDFRSERPSSVGISVYTSPMYNEAVRLAKRFQGKTRLIAGGYHATALPMSLTEYFDAVVVGEGEDAFKLAQANDGIIRTTPPDLSTLSNPDTMNLDNYNMQQSGKRTGTIITSRGCPYSCSFCGKLEDKVRYSPVQKVLEQVDYLRNAGFEAIYFTDDVFTLKKDRMKQIAEGTLMPFRVTTRANLMDGYRADVLADTGCDWASFGIESGNDGILKKSNKGMTTKQNYKAVKLMGDRGIKTKGFFIIGLPGETEQTARQTIDFSKQLRDVGLTTADFYFLTPFPGTPIWRNPKSFGINILNHDFTKYLQAGKQARCVIETEHLSSSQIEDLVNEAKSEW